VFGSYEKINREKPSVTRFWQWWPKSSSTGKIQCHWLEGFRLLLFPDFDNGGRNLTTIAIFVKIWVVGFQRKKITKCRISSIPVVLCQILAIFAGIWVVGIHTSGQVSASFVGIRRKLPDFENSAGAGI
jgi:hypothetical protein